MATSKTNKEFQKRIKKGIDPAEHSRRVRENLLRNYSASKKKNTIRKGDRGNNDR